MSVIRLHRGNNRKTPSVGFMLMSEIGWYTIHTRDLPLTVESTCQQNIFQHMCTNLPVKVGKWIFLIPRFQMIRRGNLMWMAYMCLLPTTDPVGNLTYVMRFTGRGPRIDTTMNLECNLQDLLWCHFQAIIVTLAIPCPLLICNYSHTYI